MIRKVTAPNDADRAVSSGSRLYPERPFTGALACVRRGERVLLAQRSLPPGIGKWGFPGGMQELGETIFDHLHAEGCRLRGADIEALAFGPGLHDIVAPLIDPSLHLGSRPL